MSFLGSMSASSDDDMTPRGSPVPPSRNGLSTLNPLKRRRKASGVTLADSKSLDPCETESAPSRSWLKRQKASSKAPAKDCRATSITPASSDSALSLASRESETPDTGSMTSGDSSDGSAPSAIPVRDCSNSEASYRPVYAVPPVTLSVSPGAGSYAARWSAGQPCGKHHQRRAWDMAGTSSTAELLADIASKLGHFARIVTVIGEIHPYLKAATSIINAIVKPVVTQDARDEKFEQLLKEMTLAYDCVIKESGTIARLREKPASRQRRLLEDICRESEKCALFIQEQYIGTFWIRAAKNAFRGAEVDEKIDQYKSTFSSLRASWHEELLHHLKGDMILDKLSPLRHAGQSNQRACMADTRIAVLNAIRQWIDAADSPRVLFVLGVAGSGKTSISNTVAEIGQQRAMLGAFFAFNRADSIRAPGALLGTVAHQLASWNETYRDWLVGILKDDVMLIDSPDIMKQWKRLIVEPAASMSSSGPVLVVIDAFDECPELDDHSRQHLLDCLTLHAAELPDRFRVLVTSRPLDKVSQAMTTHSVGRLDLSDFSAVADINLYVRHQLPLPLQGGLSDQDCDAVAAAAGGLFQWAATACRFLASRLAGTTMSAKLRANFQRIVHGDPGCTQRRDGPPSLDELYATVLEDTFDVEDMTAMANFRSVVATMLCTETTLSVDILQSIYERARPSSSGLVKGVLGSMGVVLEGAVSPHSPVRPMHLSFREFLLDKSRSGPWHISGADTAHGHRILTLGGLRIMASDLKFNMHRLPSSLTESMRAWEVKEISPTSLAYSIVNLHRHLTEVLHGGVGPTNDDRFCEALRRLLYHKLLFWIEWSVVRREGEALGKALQLVQQMLAANDLQFARDAVFFWGSFESIEANDPADIYLSCLPFAPADSHVRLQYIPHFPGIPTVKPLFASWTAFEKPCVTKPPRVAWSMDGRYIRENSEDRPSRCWDARTGDAADLPLGIQWRSPSLQSADGRTIISFSRDSENGKLEVYVERNQIKTRLEGAPKSDDGRHQADVSPDGKWLVLIDSDNDVYQWNLDTGEWAELRYPQTSTEKAPYYELSASFSPDSREIVFTELSGFAHRVFVIDSGRDDPQRTNYTNFRPQPRLDADGKEFPDADLRCEDPDIVIPKRYQELRWHPGMRLLVGPGPFTIDFANACYGTEWAGCYDGGLDGEEILDELAYSDLV